MSASSPIVSRAFIGTEQPESRMEQAGLNQATTLPEIDDAALLARVATQDHAAFAILVKRHSTRFYHVAYRYLGSRSESEDMVQSAFMKLWERPDLWQVDRNAAFTTWFHRIVINQCLDHVKRKKPVSLLDDSWIEDDRPSHEHSLMEQQQQQLLERQIRQLPERQRTALNLCFYEDHSNKDAARIMGIRLKALQALLMRAKTTLKKELQSLAGGR